MITLYRNMNASYADVFGTEDGSFAIEIRENGKAIVFTEKGEYDALLEPTAGNSNEDMYFARCGAYQITVTIKQGDVMGIMEYTKI